MDLSLSDRYISLMSDFGFRRVFGTESNKPLLIDFLNTLLPTHHQIQDLRFKNTDALADTAFEIQTVFAMDCDAQSGDHFIVEIQKGKPTVFKDHSLYHASFPIQAQADQAEWRYKLTAVYIIGILDFVFDPRRPEEWLHIVEFKDEQGRVFSNKLKFIYIELAKFQKPLEQLETHLDQWLFLLRQLDELDAPPPQWQEAVFTQLFALSDLANFSPAERQAYYASLRIDFD
jgi:predicted transposase/invertase (TIGR01784 family)